MNKISLVTRRKDKAFDAPTAASQRARERLALEQAERPEEHEDDISVSHEEGAPTIELEMQQSSGIDPEAIAEEYLKGRDEAEIRTRISKEQKSENKWELKLQFLPEHTSKLLSAQELAMMLGVSIHTIYSMRKKGKITGYKVGHAWRFIWTEVLEALEKK